MLRTYLLVSCLALMLCSAAESNDENATKNESKQENVLPTPTDEENIMRVPPDHMKCDACAGSTFHIWWKLKKAHKENFQRYLKESEVLEVIDDACMPRTYATTYGIKKVGSRHHLSGDGLKFFSVQSPTVGTLQPGMWLVDSCRATQGEIGEDELYTMFRVYHVQMHLEKPDVAMFRHICIKLRKQCTHEEGLETYDNYEPADDKVQLIDL